MTPEISKSDQSKDLPLSPLAERMRPRNLEEFVGQEHLLGAGKFLRRMLESGKIFPLIFWGPPGSGKTTLAQMMARYTRPILSNSRPSFPGLKRFGK